MARLTQKQTLLVIAGVTTLLCGGAGGGVHWAYGLIEEQNQQIDAKENEIEAGRKKIAKIPDVEERVIVLRENVKNYVRILPAEAELTRFTRKVQDFAMKAGISIDRFVPVRGGNKGGAFQKQSYQYYFQASLWQFMKFMNFFENYDRFVGVRDFTLTRGEPGRDGADAMHNIRMTVETYVYDPKMSGKLTRIANYDKKVRRLRPIIEEASSLLLGENYKFNGRDGRRDIFIDPRSNAGDDNNGLNATMAQQRRLIEENGTLVSGLTAKWDRSLSPDLTVFDRIEMQREVKEGVRALEDRITEVTDQKLIKNPALNSRWYKEVQIPFKELTRKLSKGNPDALKYLGKSQFEELIGKIKDNLAQGELDAAISQYGSFQSRIEVPKNDPRYAYRVKIESLVIQAKIAKEFSAINLNITGVLVNELGKSGVIINGEVYEEGEYIDPTLFVKTVRSEEIEFVYKGFTLVKTL